VTVEAAYSKHRRQDVQPLPVDVAATLAEYLSEADADHPFPMPVRAAEMLRADMTAARKAWIAGGHNEQERHARENDRDFLMPRDSSGRVLDVHSFRHGYVTAICKAAVSPRVMMSLARHSDPRLTMKRYSRVAIADTAGALAMLPKLGETTGKSDDATSLRATGTDSANATQDAPQCPRSDDQPTARPMDPPPLRLTADTLAQGTENHRVSAFAKLGDKVRIPANANEQQAEQIDSSKSVALQGKPAYSEGVAGSGGVRRPGGAPGLQNQSGKTTAADASRTCDKPPSRACQSPCQILAEITPSDPELAAIVKAWPHVSPAIREALAKMATGSANTHHKKGGQK
jgi:hypothetical protein